MENKQWGLQIPQKLISASQQLQREETRKGDGFRSHPFLSIVWYEWVFFLTNMLLYCHSRVLIQNHLGVIGLYRSKEKQTFSTDNKETADFSKKDFLIQG